MPESPKHTYLAPVVAVIIAAMITGAVGVSNRFKAIEASVLHRDSLNQQFSHLEYRIKKLESLCCSEVGEPTGGL